MLDPKGLEAAIKARGQCGDDCPVSESDSCGGPDCIRYSTENAIAAYLGALEVEDKEAYNNWADNFFPYSDVWENMTIDKAFYAGRASVING